MTRDHPCYPHKATCDWCRICIRGDCCDNDGESKEEPAELVVAVGRRSVGGTS